MMMIHLNPVLANKYGIVMGTSHHEPMLRAQQEWKRYGTGQWNYDSNEVVLRAFGKKELKTWIIMKALLPLVCGAMEICR